MNKSAIAKFIGVFVSLLVIWVINDLLLIQPCLDEGGVFQYEKGQCLLENGSIYHNGFGDAFSCFVCCYRLWCFIPRF